MILADKIIEERKRMGWSQEELADKLDVSRQSVSKWEGAQSVPDINRIIMMADLFGVSTDYLLKDDAVKEGTGEYAGEASDEPGNVRRVSMEEASEFINVRKKFAPIVALGVVLCILSPIVLIVLSGLSTDKKYGISETLAAGIGIVVLLVMVALGVLIFIRYSIAVKDYSFFEKVEIETAYGVSGMAKERRKQFEGTYNRNITVGVVLCILSCVPLIVTSLIVDNAHIITMMVGVLLAIVAIAVYLFVTAGIIKSSYDMLLEEGDYSKKTKKASPVMSMVSKIRNAALLRPEDTLMP